MMNPISGNLTVFGAMAVAMTLLLAGCTADPVGPGPERVGQMYFDAIKSGDFEAAADMYVLDVPRSMVVSRLRDQHQRMGDLENYRMTDLVSYIASGGMRYTLRFTVRYNQGHATENLMLFQSAEDNLVRIAEHQRQ